MNTYSFNKRDNINTKEKVFYPFHINNFYRYLDIPNSINETDNILTYFYGTDRSYRQGCPFDNGDVVIEFNFRESNNGIYIEHHPLSYRGRLLKEEINIENIFINNHNPDYDYYGTSPNHDIYIKKLVKNLDKANKEKIKYFDSINETENFKKIPNNSMKKFKNNLVYCGFCLYN